MSGRSNTATSTQLVRDLHSVRSQLQDGPVEITSHGRTEFVMLSKERYDEIIALTDTDADRLDAKLRLVLSTVPSMVLITDRNLRVRRANRAWCNFVEIDEADIVGKVLSETRGSTNTTYICARAENVLASGKEESFELTSTFRPGRLISYTIRPWPQGVAIFSYDRTEEAKASERLMRDLAFDKVMSMLEGYAFGSLDRAGRIAFTTSSLAGLLGADPAGLRNVALETLLAPASRVELREKLQSRVKNGAVMQIEFLEDGRTFRAGRLSLAPYSSLNGQELFAFAIRRDAPDGR